MSQTIKQSPPPGHKKSKLAFLRRRIGRLSVGTITAALLLVLIAGGILVYRNNHSTPQTVETVKQEIARHYVLPTDEQPALATITDKKKLSSQFFKRAENGDKVLIYQKNQIAIVYRPSIDRVVSVGPVAIDQAPVSR